MTTIEDYRAMTPEAFKAKVKRAAQCVYLACEESVADDLSAILTVAAERIAEGRET